MPVGVKIACCAAAMAAVTSPMLPPASAWRVWVLRTQRTTGAPGVSCCTQHQVRTQLTWAGDHAAAAGDAGAAASATPAATAPEEASSVTAGATLMKHAGEE